MGGKIASLEVNKALNGLRGEKSGENLELIGILELKEFWSRGPGSIFTSANRDSWVVSAIFRSFYDSGTSEL